MMAVAKERMLSRLGPWCADLPLAADLELDKNSRLGVERKNAALHLGQELCNSTTALGIERGLLGNCIGSRIQTWNRYAYVLNNPLSYVDPTGLDCTLQDANTGSNNEQCGSDGSAGSSSHWGADGPWGDNSPWNAWGGQPNYMVNGVPMNASMAIAYSKINPIYSDPGWQLFGTGDPYERAAGCYSNVITDAERCPAFIDSNALDPLPFPLASSRVVPVRVGLPRPNTPAKPSSAVSKYVAFLGCEYNSVVATITDEEDGQGWTAYGFINAGAILAIRAKAANLIGLTFVATAGAMDVGALAKANNECTAQIYP